MKWHGGTDLARWSWVWHVCSGWSDLIIWRNRRTPNPLISYSVWPCCNPSFLQALCQARAGSHQHPQAPPSLPRREQRSVGAGSRAAQGSQLHLTEPRNTTTLACGPVPDVRSLPVTEPQQHSVRVDLSPSRRRPRPPSAQWRRK